MSTQVFVASTAFGLATLAAALDEGHFAPAGRRVLVLSNNAEMPEATAGVADVAGWPTLRTRFDAVVDHNTTLAPLHPTAWRPRAPELPLWERHLRAVWGLGTGPVHLVVESIQASPALTLARIFADASIDVYADGLMSYGPTRTTLPDDVGWRIERLLHLDLVPGLVPLLLTEWEVPPVRIGSDAFRSVIARMGPALRQAQGTTGAAALRQARETEGAETQTAGTQATGTQATGAQGTVLVVGQYLAAADLLTEAEELDLYTRMVVGAADHGARVVFKPHPGAPLGQPAALRSAAAAVGVDLHIATGVELAEAWFAGGSVSLVVGCFSTALATASALYAIPVARLGTELLLARLTPFQNSNRIPATLIDALVPALDEPGPDSPAPAGPDAAPPTLPTAVTSLVTAVGYTMQPVRYPGLREAALAFLTDNPDLHTRYFKRRRLTRLDLPGRLPPRPAPVRSGSGWSGVRRAITPFTSATHSLGSMISERARRPGGASRGGRGSQHRDLHPPRAEPDRSRRAG